MRIAVDISPLNDNRILSHRIRGTGFYLQNLKKALLEFYPDNEYQFFNRGEKLNNDLDLVHYPYFEPFFLTLPFSKKHKTIVTVHDLTPMVFPEAFPAGIKGNIKWQIQKLNLSRSDQILTDSESSKKDISRFANISSDKIDVAYLAAGEEFGQMANGKWQMAIRDKYRLPKKFILYVGDATWNKNLPRLLDAIKETNIPLVMVGKTLTERDFDKTNPWNQDLVQTQSLIEQSKNVKALGFVPTDDLVALYNLASAFIMPSLYEGFGLPILEAMQSGCPVITTREGSIPEVAGGAAFYVDAKNSKSIADGINEVFENSKLQNELAKKGLEQAKKFSWKKTAEKTVETYKKALSQ